MKKSASGKFSLFLALLCIAVQARAERSEPIPSNPEFDLAMTLVPDLDNGKRLYRGCVACHGPEGWGTASGSYPQIAGQLYPVIIKQLADFRVGNRDNPIMRAFSSSRALGEAQDIADVAGYISSLPMTADNGKGPQRDRELGRSIYQNDCEECHGKRGEGIAEDVSPLLKGQHYNYLLRQFDWIRIAKRRNADKKMTKQIKGFSLSDEIAVLSYVADLRPLDEKLAPSGWFNPDFPRFVREGTYLNIIRGN